MKVKVELISTGDDGNTVKTDIPAILHKPVESSHFGLPCTMIKTEFLEPVTMTNKDKIQMVWKLEV